MNYKTLGAILLTCATTLSYGGGTVSCRGSGVEEENSDSRVAGPYTESGIPIKVTRFNFEGSTHTIVFDDGRCAHQTVWESWTANDYLALAEAAKDKGWTISVEGDKYNKDSGCLNYKKLIVTNTNPEE